VVDRLSDPALWFDASTPPPVFSVPPRFSVEQDPEQAGRRRVGTALVTLFMGISGLILLAATGVRIHAALGTEQPRLVAIAASSPIGAAAGSPTSVSAATETAPSADPTPTTGELLLGATAAGHRIVVDGHLMKEPASSLRLSCGPHTVRIGYAGKARVAVVPCGGSVTVGL
jgi:hypothetical protein